MSMLKITSGIYKNLTLTQPPESTTRPISQKVRAAIFNVLVEKITDSNVLDLYSGSGAMGIEAISRGSKKAVLVDNSPRVLSVIRKNIKQLDTRDDILVVNKDVDNFVSSCKDKFDIIFIDPPYNEFTVDMVNRAANLLQYGGIIVVSRSSRINLGNTAEGLQLLFSKKYGDSQVDYIRKD